MAPHHTGLRRLALPIAAASALGGVAAGIAPAGLPEPAPSGVGPPVADGAGGTTLSVLDRPATPADALRVPVRPLEPEAAAVLDGMAVLDGTRLATVQGDVAVYVAPARAPGAVCLIAVGRADGALAANCPDRRVVAAGRVLLGMRGGPGSPQTLIVLVPDAVTHVGDVHGRTAALGNVAVLVRPSRPERVTLRLRGGEERTVRPG